ncbi:MAG: Piwi domain-containing protein [Acidilobaceae archaeon]
MGKCLAVLNTFEVDLEYIWRELNDPKKPRVKVYDVELSIPAISEDCIATLNNNGYYDIRNGKLYTTRTMRESMMHKDCRDKIRFKEINTITINEVPGDGVANIMKIYVLDKIRRDLNKALESASKVLDILAKVESEAKSELNKRIKGAGTHISRNGPTFKIRSWIARVLVDDNDVFVFWKDNKLYAAINVSLVIRFDGNLWDHLVKRDMDKLKELSNIRFRYLLDLEECRRLSRTYTVKRYLSEEDYRNLYNEKRGAMLSYEDLLEYPRRKLKSECREVASLEELHRSIGVDKIDPHQPIIEVESSGGEKFYFPAQYVVPVFDPAIADDVEKEILSELKRLIHHEHRRDLIIELVRQLYYLRSEPVSLVTRFDEDPKLIVNVYDVRNNSKSTEMVKTTSQILKPLSLLTVCRRGSRAEGRGYKGDYVRVPLPHKLPKLLGEMEELPFIILVEEGLNEGELEVVERLSTDLFSLHECLRRSWEKAGYRLPRLSPKDPLSFRRDSDFIEIAEKAGELTGGVLSYALIFGRRVAVDEDYDVLDYYDDLKKVLFARGIISQNVSVERYLGEDGSVDSRTVGYAFSNIFYDMLGKLGITLFTSKLSTTYDLIIGVDVGEGEVEESRTVGSIVVFRGDGVLINMIPVYVPSYPGRETGRIKDLLEYAEERGYVRFKNRRILLLRDGRLTREEQEQLKDFTRKRQCVIEVVNVRKRTPFQQLEPDHDEKGIVDWYADIGDSYLLRCHTPRTGLPRPIKVDKIIRIFDKGKFNEKSITSTELELLRNLAYLNYSTIEGRGGLRLPAPLHYADKLLKALKRGWKVNEEYLKEGMLYFL